jgi:hypothetical protein
VGFSKILGVAMKYSKSAVNKKFDRIEGNKITLYDFCEKGENFLKLVEIISRSGSRFYSLKRTSKGGYLFN